MFHGGGHPPTLPMPPTSALADTTRDALFGGRVVLHQPKRGYRVNVDALLLAAFAAEGRRVARCADLGAGVGAVGLSLLFHDASEHVTFFEVDAAAARVAERNLVENGWGARGTVTVTDVARLGAARRGSADLVVCNPPWFEPHTTRAASDASRARARSGSLRTFVLAARELLARRARACFVYPAPELARLLSTFGELGLAPKRLRFVHASASAPARAVLVEVRAARSGGLFVAPPWVEREGALFSSTLRTILGGAVPREGARQSAAPPAKTGDAS
jgi:tRNA1Val (adenine37-N6)-methyltransferase